MNDMADIDIEVMPRAPALTLTAGQAKAKDEITAAIANPQIMRWVLSGSAGTGKTTLMQSIVRWLIDNKYSVAVTAPTHKAVSVLAKKLREAELPVDAITIHSLLGLRPAPDNEKTTLKRAGKSKAGWYDAIIIDEASMIDATLFDFINKDCEKSFVLFVGDPAQLPPVGEYESRCFKVPGRSHLTEIVRQAAGNPIIRAAQMIRDSQSGLPTWEWTLPAEDGPHGIYRAEGVNIDHWMRDAFTSDDFKADNDAFRFIAYTNARVAEVNARVRSWIYGQTPTPFVVGERAVCRTPILNDEGKLAVSVNEEATVTAIHEGSHQFDFPPHEAGSDRQQVDGWSVHLPVWSVLLKPDDGDVVSCIIPRDNRQMDTIQARLVAEARKNRSRWYDRFQTREKVAILQHVYAMTAHTSQGSTFSNVIVDVADIRRAESYRPKECQQIAYVAITRARFAVVLVGAP